MEDLVNIELDKARILGMSPPEQMTLLIQLGFANHKAIKHMNKVLTGNGEPGLCETVRSNRTKLTWLWAIFAAVAVFYGGVLVTYLIKGSG